MLKLSGVSETLLIPLCARYLETQKRDGLIRDPFASEIIERLGCDCRKLAGMRSVQLGIAIRAEILDRETRRFLQNHPNAAVVSLGAGLDTRFFRVDDGRVFWVELDLEEVRRVWGELFEETERHRFLTYSALDFRWMDEVRELAGGRELLFIAEGLLMYFEEREVRELVVRLRREFPGSELLLETMGSLLARHTRQHPAVSKTDARFKWGISSTKEMEVWAEGIRCLGEWEMLNQHRRRWGWMGVLSLIPQLRRQLKIGHLRLGQKGRDAADSPPAVEAERL
jgi:O-methyltransferase involved in polyketide biosynthesis